MIENNNDWMNVNNSSVSLDRALSVGDQKSEDPDLHQPLPEKPVDLLRRNLLCSSLRTDLPGFFKSIFSSLKSGNEVSLTLIINDQTTLK